MTFAAILDQLKNETHLGAEVTLRFDPSNGSIVGVTLSPAKKESSPETQGLPPPQ